MARPSNWTTTLGSQRVRRSRSRSGQYLQKRRGVKACGAVPGHWPMSGLKKTIGYWKRSTRTESGTPGRIWLNELSAGYGHLLGSLEATFRVGTPDDGWSRLGPQSDSCDP